MIDKKKELRTGKSLKIIVFSAIVFNWGVLPYLRPVAAQVENAVTYEQRREEKRIETNKFIAENEAILAEEEKSVEIRRFAKDFTTQNEAHKEHLRLTEEKEQLAIEADMETSRIARKAQERQEQEAEQKLESEMAKQGRTKTGVKYEDLDVDN